jgi:hypothetical protein
VGTVNVGSRAPICPPLFIVALCEREVTTIHDRRLRSEHGSDRYHFPNKHVLQQSVRTVPKSLYNMSSLVDLRLSVNKLTGSIPSDFGNTLLSIRTLIFQGNYFQGPIPPSLANATNLESVNLAQSAFSGVIPSLGSLYKLNQLLISSKLETGLSSPR